MKLITSVFLSLLIYANVFAQASNNQPLSEKLADTAMNRIWVDDGNPAGIPRKWTYDQGVILKGIESLWYATGDAKYFNHIK